MASLGIVLAYICMYFVSRLKEHSVTGLTGVVGVLLGGVVAKFLTENTTAGADAIWWYPVGLLAGLLGWVMVKLMEQRTARCHLASIAGDPWMRGIDDGSTTLERGLPGVN
jgi:hypothetical protein